MLFFKYLHDFSCLDVSKVSRTQVSDTGVDLEVILHDLNFKIRGYGSRYGYERGDSAKN